MDVDQGNAPGQPKQVGTHDGSTKWRARLSVVGKVLLVSAILSWPYVEGTAFLHSDDASSIYLRGHAWRLDNGGILVVLVFTTLLLTISAFLSRFWPEFVKTARPFVGFLLWIFGALALAFSAEAIYRSAGEPLVVSAKAFDAALWAQAPTAPEPCPRGAMALSLVNERSLKGKTRAEILQMLGAPDQIAYGGAELRYRVGECSRWTGVGQTVLTVFFVGNQGDERTSLAKLVLHRRS